LIHSVAHCVIVTSSNVWLVQWLVCDCEHRVPGIPGNRRCWVVNFVQQTGQNTPEWSKGYLVQAAHWRCCDTVLRWQVWTVYVFKLDCIPIVVTFTVIFIVAQCTAMIECDFATGRCVCLSVTMLIRSCGFLQWVSASFLDQLSYP